MPVDFQLNVPQQVFTLFFAITWGTAANSQPRWKAFAWGAIGDREAGTRCRLLLSLAVLNAVPLIYFVLILGWLSSGVWNSLSQWNLKAMSIILMSTIPALAPFGFYRIWIGCVELSPERFYGVTRNWCRNWQKDDPLPPAWERIGIDIKPNIDLNPDWTRGNMVWGVVYVIVGLAVSLILTCL